MVRSASKSVDKKKIEQMINDEIRIQENHGIRNRAITLTLNREKALDSREEKKNREKIAPSKYGNEKLDPIASYKAQELAQTRIEAINEERKREEAINTNTNLYELPKYKVQSTQLYAMSDAERRAMSVVNVNSLIREPGETDGLFDERMGTIEKTKECVTCGRNDRGCRGHAGHIELPVKFVNPIFQKQCIWALDCICPFCGDTYITEAFAQALGVYSMPESKRLKFCSEISNAWLHKLHNHGTPHCEYNKDFTGHKLCFTITKSDKTVKKYVRSIENMEKIFSTCPREKLKIIGFTGKSHPLNFIMSCIVCAPPCIRPPAFVDGKPRDHFLTTVYHQILSRIFRLQSYMNSDLERDLELDNLYSDIKMIAYGPEKKLGNKISQKEAGIFPSFKTKRGQMRGNMMGKRVDHCGRSVAGPGYELHPGEVKIPASFAKILYVEVVVNRYNLPLVIARYKRGDYKFIKMKLVSEKGIFQIKEHHLHQYIPQIGDVLIRPIETGDRGLTGRQPSLHAESIMGYNFVVDKYETIKIHSSNNACFNADFDGDEVTIHIAQTIMAMVECMTVMNFKNHILNVQSNRPMMALAFHGLIGWFLATADWGRGNIIIPIKRFNQALSLINNSYRKETLFRRLEIVSEYTKTKIEKYSGNTLFSLCLPTNFTYEGGGLKIVDGILVKGTLKKSNIGLKVNSLIQIIAKMYSIPEACRFLNDAQILADWFTMWHGFSIGYKDFNANRSEVLKMLKKDLNKMQLEFYNLGPRPKDPIALFFWMRNAHNLLDRTKDNGKKIGEEYLKAWNGLNILSDDRGSGAKGSGTNTSQITGSLGAQFVGASIIMYELKNGTRCLPFFVSDDVAVESIGYVVNSYMDGISLSACIFHNIAARLGLIDTAKSTAEVGYTHRRVEKSLEPITISWLGMVTSTDGRMFQPLFNCGFDVSKMVPVNTKRYGEKIFFCDMQAEANLLNRIYERKHLGGKKLEAAKEVDEYEVFRRENGRRPKFSELQAMGIDCVF